MTHKTVYENGKPMYVIVCHYGEDMSVLWRIWTIRNNYDIHWAKAVCQKVEGNHVIMWFKCTEVTLDDYMRVAPIALRESGIIQ